MVKTTINLDDELYKRLVQEAVQRYGNTRTLSKLINEKLRETESTDGEGRTEEEIKRRLGIVRRSAGSWKIKETGTKYVRRIRRQSERRLKKMGL